MQEEKKGIPIPEVLLIMVQQLNYIACEKEAKLQMEESGNNVARLQGYLAGVRSYKQALRDNAWELARKYNNSAESKLPFFTDGTCNLELQELRDIVADIEDLLDDSDYHTFSKVWNKTVEIQKDTLFYESEKGRDLHFCKGWYDAMSQVDTWIRKLNSELAAKEKQHAESLPFDGSEI